MDPKWSALVEKLPIDKETLSALLPLIARYGARGAVIVARGYLGPVAGQIEQRCGAEPAKPSSGERGEGLKPEELELLGVALTKLLYEAGELALHNPRVTSDGKQPEFKLDECGYAPAFSLAHVIAAARVVREQNAERQAREQATREARARATLPATPRARLLTARAEQYAATNRYGYVPPPSPSRVPR